VTWSAASGAKINDAMRVFLDALATRVAARDPSIAIYVTSGYRTVTDQARALVTKIQLGDDLAKLYRRGYGPQIVAAVLGSEDRSQAGIAAVLDSFAARGIYLSPHMRGDALDLGTTGGSMTGRALSQGQINILAEEARALGAETLQESTPPHLHIQHIGGGSGAVSAAADAARGALQRSIGGLRVGGALVAWRRWGRWGVASVALFVGGWIFWRWIRRKRGSR